MIPMITVVRHEVAGVHVAARLGAQLAAVAHGLAQDVAGGDVGEAELLADPLGLRALAGPGRPEQDQVELGHRAARRRPVPDHYFRKPS